MKDKIVLVTGGLGFIGSHLVDELLNDNEVIVIDNKSSGKIENLKQSNHENLLLIEKDLNDIDIDYLMYDVDYVFHLAGNVSVPLSINNPVNCTKNNFNATVKLLESSRKNDVDKVVFSSSSAVYGDNKNLPLNESEYPLPMSPYASSKISCEMYLKSYYEVYGLKYVGLRYFNVFGERQNMNGEYAAVIPNFIKKLVRNEKPIIYGDGNQTRDFIYVKDVVNSNIKAAESNYNGIVNIASGRKMTINELCRIICQVLDKDFKVEYKPPRKGEIRHSVANVKKMKKIDYEVDVNKFESQLKNTVKWIKENIEG